MDRSAVACKIFDLHVNGDFFIPMIPKKKYGIFFQSPDYHSSVFESIRSHPRAKKVLSEILSSLNGSGEIGGGSWTLPDGSEQTILRPPTPTEEPLMTISTVKVVGETYACVNTSGATEEEAYFADDVSFWARAVCECKEKIYYVSIYLSLHC